jgi:hypothetical protein
MNVACGLQSSRLQHTGLLWPSQRAARLCTRELAECRSFTRRNAVVRAAADQEQVIVAACIECGPEHVTVPVTAATATVLQ